MRRFIVVFVVAALAACSPPAPTEGAPGEVGAAAPAVGAAIADPAPIVRSLYARYLEDGPPNFPPLEEQAPWSEAMRQALAQMRAREFTEEGPILDFDPFVNAQDWELQNVEVSTDGVVAQSHATVRAAITNAGFREEIVYDLVWEGESWRVDNIRNADWDLRAIAGG